MSNTPDEILFALTDSSVWDVVGITQDQYDELAQQLSEDREEAKQAFYQFILTEVIGEDAMPSPTASDSAYHKTIGGNIVRKFQRQTLAKLFNKEEISNES